MRLYLHGTRRVVSLRTQHGSILSLHAHPGRLTTVRGRLGPTFKALLRRRGRLFVDAVAVIPQIEAENAR